MKLNAWSKSLYDNFRLERVPTEQLSAWHRNPTPPAVSVPAVFFNCSDATSSLMFSSSSGHLPTRRLQALSSSSHSQNEQNASRGRQAKRARVENLIQSMSGSPAAQFSEAMTNLYGEIQDESMQKHNSVTLHQDQMEMMALQLQSQHQPLRQLETSPKVKTEESNSREPFVEEKSCWDASSTLSRNSFEDLYNELQSNSDGWRKPINYSQHKAEKVKLMADVLKCELSKAVSTSVDSIFRSAPLLQMSPKREVARDDTFLLNPLVQPSVCRDHRDHEAIPVFQTEALSLVVQKDKSDTIPHHRPKLKHRSSEEIPESNLKLNKMKSLRDECFDTRRAKVIDRSWYALKVNSREDERSQSHTVDRMLLKSLHLPRMKSPDETSSLVQRVYMLNERLTTNHLKKAKLMFFYTRYPSSLVLKMCFGEVQFTRCITSQLIKWFSNFREYYYIQMEKFARHAVIEGVTDQRDLTVGRESELFRVLNSHYNKTNDFQVPDRFLEVAGITLREFYAAISLGKDRDPSWKKAIYRVICKLDSDVPGHFKTVQSK